MTETLQPLVELVTPALDELAQLDQWVISRLVSGQKPPFSPHTRQQCSHSNPEHWSSYQTALTALPGFDWLGFVFHDADPYSGIDLDGCRNPKTGEIESWAQRIIDMCGSYSEISPSETGVKIFVRGTLPAQLLHSMGPHKGIEVYSTKRYFTFTGRHLAGTPAEIRDAQPALDSLWTEYHKEPAPAAPRKEYKVSKGEAANDRQNARDVIAGLNRSNDAGEYLEHKGATLIRTRGDSRYYTGLAGDQHNNSQTYIVSPAKDGVGHICFSYSPNGKLSKADFPRGFRWFDAVCALEHSGDVTAALKELNPIQPRKAHQEAHQPATVYRTAAQDADAERKRAERRAAAEATRNQVAERASADERLTPSDRATLQAMLDWAAEHNASVCWAGRATIARRAGYSLGSVKRSTMLLKDYGYFESEGTGGAFYQTAKRTFTRGSLFADETISNAKDDPRRESVACEGGLVSPALEKPAPAQQEAEIVNYSVDCVRYDASGRVVWRLWDDTSNQVLGEYDTEAEALAVVVPNLAQAATPVEQLADQGGGWIGYEGGAQFKADFVPSQEAQQEAPAASVVIQLDPLAQAPPLSTDAAYTDFIWRWHAAQQTTRSQSQRARFKREAESYLVDVLPEEAVLRWEALRSPSRSTRPNERAPSQAPARRAAPAMDYQGALFH